MLTGGVRSGWRTAGVVALMSLVPLTAATVPTAATAATNASTAAPTEMPNEVGALRAARTAGKPVEVTGLRTKESQVYANPSGTLTAVLNAFPVRVRNGNGTWSAVDTRLRRMPDGSVGAAASPLKARLSGGGSGPVLRIARDGGEITLGWPGALPAPVLSDDTATYPEVLPGVDLRVRWTVDRAEDFPPRGARHSPPHRPLVGVGVGQPRGGPADGRSVGSGLPRRGAGPRGRR